MNKSITVKNKSLSYLKWFLISASIIILAAIFVIIFAGFNTSIDFAGGSVLHVKLGSDALDKENYSENFNKVKEILGEHNICIYSVQTSGKLAEKSLIIKYKNPVNNAEMEQVNELIRININEEFNLESFVEIDDEFDITANSGIITGVIAKTLFKYIVSIVAVITLTLLYFLFRKSLLLSLTMVGTMILSVLLTLALTALIRLPISMVYVTSLIAICVFNIISLILITEKLHFNKESKNPKDSYAVAFKTLLTLCVIFFAFAALMFILAKAYVAEFVGTVLIGVLINFVVIMFAGVSFLNIFDNTSQKKNKKTQTEVTISENNSEKTDASAPVIEINEDNK